APPTHRPAVTARAAVDAERAAFPSLATRSFAASRFEREIADLFGLVPTGHPDPRRLALHQFWPEGYHPLRRDAVARTDVAGDGGMIVNDTGYAFGHGHCCRLRERLLRLNARLTGHRLLRGAVVPGGVAGPIASADLEQAAREVERVVAEFVDIARLSLDNTMVLERLQGTGRLTTRTAREMQVVGMVARASGIDADARRDAPFATYGALPLQVPVYETGDVWARTMVRIEEARQSAALIGEAARRAAPGAVFAAPGPLRAGAH